MSLSEPCNRGALKGTHQSFVFLEEMVGTPAQERFTESALHGEIYRELLSSAQPGKPAKHAPRMLSPMLAFLEQYVMKETSPSSPRVVLGGCSSRTGPLRFSDHWGVTSEVTFREGAFQAQLTRSKTRRLHQGTSDRACCFFSQREWLTKGWSLLQGMANFPRGYSCITLPELPKNGALV